MSFLASCRLALGLVLAALVAGGCAGTNDSEPESGPEWTTRQAESITSIRGMRVRVRSCRGLGRSANGDGGPRYKRFDCVAGARATSIPYEFDTVAVLYVLHPLADYSGPGSKHRLTNVRFVGGPGVP